MIASMKPSRIAVTRPCAHCPFRQDVEPFLRRERVREIFDAARRGQHFVCHETVDYGERPGRDKNRRACAGFLILCRRDGLFDGLQIVQLAERLAGIDFSNLRGAASIYASVAAMERAHDPG